MKAKGKLQVVDNPHIIHCGRCGADIRLKDCGCDAPWKVGEKVNKDGTKTEQTKSEQNRNKT